MTSTMYIYSINLYKLYKLNDKNGIRIYVHQYQLFV